MRSTIAIVALVCFLILLGQIVQLGLLKSNGDRSGLEISLTAAPSSNHDVVNSTTHSSSSYCRKLLGDDKHLQARVLNHTVHQLDRIFDSPLVSQDWLEIATSLWNKNNPRHLVSRSTVNPLRPDAAKRLLNILERRIDDPLHNPPLHVMIFGGSIVLGNGAAHQVKYDKKGNDTLARWSTQWQQLINAILGDDDLVQVTNMANGGMTTDVSTIPLQYGVYPNAQPPDFIIASFGYNDMSMMLAKKKNPYLANLEAEDQYMYLVDATQRFVRAAKSTPVLLVDDSFMIPDITIRHNLMHSRAIAEVASWYNVWAVSWSRAFLHVSYSTMDLSNLTEQNNIYWPLWGGNLKTAHPNIYFHTGMAWLLFYQFVEMSVQACVDKDNNDDTVTTPSTFAELDSQFIPPIDNHAHFQEIPAAWLNASTQHAAKQRSKNSNKTASTTACSYLWIANRATSIQTKQDVKRAVESVLLSNRGWMEEGNAVRKPRPGWVAMKPKAVFEVRVNATSSNIDVMRLLYMKSYGEKWRDSQVGITVRVRRGNATLIKRKMDLVGYHASNTSVNYEATMKGLGAQVGDYIVAKFAVIGGSTFRINGMLFCEED